MSILYKNDKSIGVFFPECLLWNVCGATDSFILVRVFLCIYGEVFQRAEGNKSQNRIKYF